MKPQTIEVKAEFAGTGHNYNAIVDEDNIVDVITHSDEIIADRDEIISRFMALVILDSTQVISRYFIEDIHNGPKTSLN